MLLLFSTNYCVSELTGIYRKVDYYNNDFLVSKYPILSFLKAECRKTEVW